ncbi:CPBP family intramembrane metalloprotease [Staphylococcus felis]|uniref:CPBP family intramembrane glutamic endopeptidase n=3 Tax=Staphylococcus felis TaxID=46127 RepID=UPI000E273449|nr:type II CAAX endopeptidase family protein [Staphylococcus felis]REH77467.1 CPBP family intramembrane metalloprotease [Staphylococcus felis]REI08466.1 CPBP family intramembrane metalloprotease [Staphylococcus felis]REI25617.1 CPBP family intramembrane metalloprotease [Staphylococcus felis]REI30984.1 CPBP family intramembrane metalloprotease [Staphylococcus felis]UXR86728.1 CPBP family intramembrane metalloprotease [Staphylococcus felis]
MDVLRDNRYSKLEIIFLCIGLTILATFILNMGSLIIILLPDVSINNLQIIGLGISMIVGFILTPTILLHRLIGFNYSVIYMFSMKRFLIYIVIIFTILLFFSIKTEDIIHPFIVATCEEFLFRGIFFSLLLSKFSKFKAILIGSLIFSLLLHLNGNFIENFIIKFPASIILYLIRDKLGLQESIVVHWLYNLFITKISS